jgi:hypothetical protein
MTDKIDDGGPAYPSRPPMARITADDPQSFELVRTSFDGMSLRDYFAAQAISQMISLSQDRYGGWSTENVAAGCYSLADAMLSARKGKT